MASGRVHLQVDYPHVLRVMCARLEREGFTEDTPERRRLIQLMAGPKPTNAGKLNKEESTWPTH